MNTKIVLAAIIMSVIAFVYIMTYPAGELSLPYIPHATITCGATTYTTTLQPPTTESSNAIIGPAYTYYYSNIIIINGRTCTVNGKVTIYHKRQ